MKRILRLDDHADVIIEVYHPELDPDTDGHYVCRYTVDGLSKRLNGYSMGVDEIQAAILALRLIGNRLYTRNEFKSGRLRWPFSSNPHDLGFPIED